MSAVLVVTLCDTEHFVMRTKSQPFTLLLHDNRRLLLHYYARRLTGSPAHLPRLPSAAKSDREEEEQQACEPPTFPLAQCCPHRPGRDAKYGGGGSLERYKEACVTEVATVPAEPA